MLEVRIAVDYESFLEALTQSIDEHAAVVEACKQKGHPHSQVHSLSYFSGKFEKFMICPDCSSVYGTGLTSGESFMLQRNYSLKCY